MCFDETWVMIHFMCFFFMMFDAYWMIINVMLFFMIFMCFVLMGFDYVWMFFNYSLLSARGTSDKTGILDPTEFYGYLKCLKSSHDRSCSKESCPNARSTITITEPEKCIHRCTCTSLFIAWFSYFHPPHGPQQRWPAGWPGHPVCGLHTMYMYVGYPQCIVSPPCIGD